MTEPLPRCKVGRKGRHELNCILPDTVENPAVLYCVNCGSTKSVLLKKLPPADDVIAYVERMLK